MPSAWPQWIGPEMRTELSGPTPKHHSLCSHIMRLRFGENRGPRIENLHMLFLYTNAAKPMLGRSMLQRQRNDKRVV